MKRLPALLFCAAAALRIAFHALVTPIAWDASVYIGMAKAIVTFGAGGIWEPLRPIVWPLLLTPSVWLHVNPVVAGHVLQFLIGMGVVGLTYLIARKTFGEQTAVWALAFVALSPLLAFYEHQLLTEQVSVFFALLAVFALQRERLVLAGVTAGFAFLSKFPEGIILVGIGAAIVLGSKRWNDAFVDGSKFACGFLVPVLFFFGLNWALYQNPFAPFTAANDVIKTSGLWLYQDGPLYYIQTLLEQNIFAAFALPGIVLALRRNRAKLAVLLSGVLVLGYLSLLPHKEVRFLPLALPFIFILAAAGWTALLELRRVPQWKHAIMWCALLLIAVFAAQALRWGQYDATYEGAPSPALWERLYPEAANGASLMVSSDPRVTLFTDDKIVPLYYPLFPQNLTEGLRALEGGRTLLYSRCDVPCATDDAACQRNLALFENIVNRTWKAIDQSSGTCAFTLYARP
jgi:4-amino-4-deoxy-L-arabinose transferase-like glycosyltransferase